MSWKIIDTGKRSPEENMAIDAALLQGLREEKQPILHFYDWEGPSATYGHFLNPDLFLNRDASTQSGLRLAKRPTGGGIVFHLTDFAFSILIPATHPFYTVNTLENYAFVNRIVARAAQCALALEAPPSLLDKEADSSHPNARHFCMAKPTLNDVMLEGKKVGGGAQRRTKHGFLHQGTISLGIPEKGFLEKVLKDPQLFHSFLECSDASLAQVPKGALSNALIDSCNWVLCRKN